MACTCVVGLQWGDEAKGKIVDLLTADHDYVVRYNGGANAGHTVVWGPRTFKLSLLPTGILHDRVRAVIGNGVVVYPPRFREEVEQLRSAGISIGDNLIVSDHAHVIFPYHMEEERLSEQENGSAIGTTGRGIGPCYQDKVGRVCGIRVGDLLDESTLRERLSSIVPRKNRILQALATNGSTVRFFDAEALAAEYHDYGEYLRPYVTDTTHLLHRALQGNKRLLFEAAQGSLLDVDHGTYPYVTSSNSTPAGIWSGTGVPSRCLTRVVGVLKAYTTRVGRGPFPTELDDGPDGIGERIRKIGREYGTVTGRPRRVGWLDAVSARYTVLITGADELAVTLLDVLSGLPELSICTGYQVEESGKTVQIDYPSDPKQFARCRPIFERLPGWTENLANTRRLADLPTAARRYLDRIAELVHKPITFVSVGADRERTIRS